MKTKMIILLASFFLSIVACSRQKENEKSAFQEDIPPNILLILVDDMGYSDLSSYGSEIATPNIDELAKKGMRMTNFYNAARCCPSRASILTGLYPHRAGMGHQNHNWGHPSYQGRIKKEAITIAQALKNEGYSTYQVGKWHVGNEKEYWPGAKGFDQYFSLIEGAMSYYNQWPWLKNQDTLTMTYNGVPFHTGDAFFATDDFSDSAVSFIKNHDNEKPFFMYLAYNAPHWPLHAKPEDIALFRGKYIQGWDVMREKRFQELIRLQLVNENFRLSERDPSVPPWESLSKEEKEEWDLKMSLYAAVMHRLDLGVGKVISALKEKGDFENTMIIFLSDNGGCHEDPTGPWSSYPEDGEPGSERSFPSYGYPWANASNTPYRYFKSWVHEGGIKTPLIVSFPGVVPENSINTTTRGHIMDIFPTILDLIGTDYKTHSTGNEIENSDGISFLPALKGQEFKGHDTLFWEHQYNRAVIAGKWKLVSAWKIPKNGKSDNWELYDLENDPTESIDLAEENQDLVNELIATYESWAKELMVLSKSEIDSLKRQIK